MAELQLAHGALHFQEYPAEQPGGSTVVLLHGLGSCGDDWPLQVQALVRRHRVFTVDLPGHGRSAPLKRLPRLGDLAGAVLRLLESQCEGPVHLVGLSLGGAVALQLALDAPDRIRSLTIVNSFAHLRPSDHGLLRGASRLALLLFAPMDRVGSWVAGGLFPDEAQTGLRRLAADRLAANRRRTYLSTVLAVLRFDVRRRLAQISCPALIVAGERDATVPLSAKLELQAGLPRARLVRLPTSGHATPLDAPEAFNRALVSFLAEVEGEC